MHATRSERFFDALRRRGLAVAASTAVCGGLLVVLGCGVGGQTIEEALKEGTPPASEADRNAAYSDRMDQARQTNTAAQKDSYFARNGRDKSVEVLVTGVTGDPAAAKDYLTKKLSRAAGHDSAEAQRKAQEQTEANRKAAEEKAKNENRGGFIVHYQYQRVESELGYPSVQAGPAANGTYVFYASPVLDLNAFADRFGVGKVKNVDAGNRRVEIQALLPDPIPDFDVEQMQVRHGAANVAVLVVNNAPGDPAAVMAYLKSQAAGLDPKINLEVAGLKETGLNGYQMTIAPVGDLATLANRIHFGKVSGTDYGGRVVTVAADLPDPLPEIVKPSAGGGGGGPSIFDDKPQPGESTVDWALRIVKAGGHHSDKALTELASMEANPADLPRVSETLIARLPDSWPRSAKYAEALVKWKTPAGAQALADEMKKDWAGFDFETYVGALNRMEMPEAQAAAAETVKAKIIEDRANFNLEKYLNALDKLNSPDVAVAALRTRLERETSSFGDRDALAALARYKTPEAAEAAATQLTSRWLQKDAAKMLRTIGTPGEPVVVKLLKHPVPEVRAEAASILYEIGTQEGLEGLGKAINSESVPLVKTHFREARKALMQKLKDAEPADDEK